MSGGRRSRLSREDSDEMYSSDSGEPNFKKMKSNKFSNSLNQGKDDVANKLAISTARVMLGLSSKNQVLNKNMIAKILEFENEKGSGMQFKKLILPILNQLFNDIFHYEVVELNSKKSIQQSIDSNSTKEQKLVPSDDFILINKLPVSLRALNYSFMAEYTQPIGKSLKEMDKPKENASSTSIYGENLPRPTSILIENGITLLIICTVLLHGNNILQSDLLLILKTKFGLAFKEHEIVSILGNQTLYEFLAQLHKQDYLDRTLVTNTDKNSNARSLISKNAKYEDNNLMIKLGRRCVAEWSMDEFINLFRQIMQDQWTDQLQESVLYTVSSFWGN